MMRATTYTHFRRNLSATIDGLAADHEPVLITRGDSKPAAVIMSLEDFAAYEETRYLLASPKNATRLRQAVADLEAGGGVERSLSE